MPAGRPKEYNEEYIQKVDEYLKVCKDEFEEWHKTRGEKSDTYERITRVRLPSIEGFAEYIDVSKKSLFNWEKEHAEFLHSLDKIRTAQHNRLVDNGLGNIYSPVITKLMLSNNHGYREKSDLTTDGKQLPTPILDVHKNNSDKEDNGPEEAN